MSIEPASPGSRGITCPLPSRTCYISIRGSFHGPFHGLPLAGSSPRMESLLGTEPLGLNRLAGLFNKNIPNPAVPQAGNVSMNRTGACSDWRHVIPRPLPSQLLIVPERLAAFGLALGKVVKVCRAGRFGNAQLGGSLSRIRAAPMLIRLRLLSALAQIPTGLTQEHRRVQYIIFKTAHDCVNDTKEAR